MKLKKILALLLCALVLLAGAAFAEEKSEVEQHMFTPEMLEGMDYTAAEWKSTEVRREIFIACAALDSYLNFPEEDMQVFFEALWSDSIYFYSLDESTVGALLFGDELCMMFYYSPDIGCASYTLVDVGETTATLQEYFVKELVKNETIDEYFKVDASAVMDIFSEAFGDDE